VIGGLIIRDYLSWGIKAGREMKAWFKRQQGRGRSMPTVNIVPGSQSKQAR